MSFDYIKTGCIRFSNKYFLFLLWKHRAWYLKLPGFKPLLKIARIKTTTIKQKTVKMYESLNNIL